MPAREPDPFRDTFVAMAGARAVIAAVHTGVVRALAEEAATPASLAARLGLDLLGCEALLAALEALGYLERGAGETYRPTPAGMRLVPGTEESLAHFVGAYSADAWEMLGTLEQVLADPHIAASHRRPAGDAFWESYIRGLYELGRVEQKRSAALVALENPRLLLDIAGGHGGFAMAMCRRFPKLRATVLDLPASAAVGRRIVAEEGFAQRVAFREGDALEAQLGEDLDVVSIFNLLHHLPPTSVRELLARCHGALRRGGMIVVGETEPAEPHEPPSLEGAMSGLVYFVSSATRNYSRAELAGWIEQAGFAAVEVRGGAESTHRLLYLARA